MSGPPSRVARVTDDPTSHATAAAAEPDLGYEQARDELVEVVRRLEAGGTTLEEALALWERGEQLADVCDRHLTGARRRLDASIARRESGGRG